MAEGLKTNFKISIEPENLNNPPLQYVLTKHKAKRIYKGLSRNEWYNLEIWGNIFSGVELVYPDNRMFIDVQQDCEYIVLSKFFILNKNCGLGTSIMNSLIEYAKKERKILLVVHSINDSFYKKFPELVHDGNGDFEYNGRK